MIETIVKVDGMMCGMCESHVNEAVRKAFPEVKGVVLAGKSPDGDPPEQPLDEQKLRDAINATGYEVKGVSAPYEKKAFLVLKSKQTLTHIREAYLDEDSGLRCGRFGLRAGPCADAEQKNVVTLLARGEWKEMIDQKGLVIRHCAAQDHNGTDQNRGHSPRMIIMISSLWSCRRASCRMCFLCSRPTRASILCLWATTRRQSRCWNSCSARRIRSHSAFRARQAAVNTTMWSVCTPVLA